MTNRRKYSTLKGQCAGEVWQCRRILRGKPAVESYYFLDRSDTNGMAATVRQRLGLFQQCRRKLHSELTGSGLVHRSIKFNDFVYGDWIPGSHRSITLLQEGD
ncbi:MAG TPA: hypothetical protein VF317_07130 [Dermatophilaceae bacterium]